MVAAAYGTPLGRNRDFRDVLVSVLVVVMPNSIGGAEARLVQPLVASASLTVITAGHYSRVCRNRQKPSD